MKAAPLQIHRLWQKKWFQVVCVLGMWTLIGSIFATQLFLFALNTGYPATLSEIMRWELTRWCLWAALTPWILSIAKGNPIQTPNAASKILRHVLISLAVSLVHVSLYSALYWLIKSFIREPRTQLDFAELVKAFKYVFSIDFHLGVFVYWAILASMLTVRFYRNAAQLQLELTKAQLQALKMQIHPHFLFNTLNSISALLHKNPKLADDMVGSLGDFLRLTLQNSGADVVPLQKEIDFLKCYLEIEQIRFQDRLIATFELDRETQDAIVPNMLLQPIIENAIKHGIADRPDLGHILIRTQRRGEMLRIIVKDDGPGIRTGTDTTSNGGIGLRNIRERLNHLYGMNQSISLSNGEGGGLLVTVEIPFMKSESGQEEAYDKNTNAHRG